ncbi:MAG: hypothetical protein JNK43_04235 [Ignavibacteria bacterium]|nr:hypothetical protein [Ignavibacteria bacterium]
MLQVNKVILKGLSKKGGFMAHENLFKIYIPEPCFEDWDKMTPTEQGAFCGVCSKDVIDFSGRSEDEIQKFLAENLDKKICGRFKSSQLCEESDEVPPLKINIEEPKFRFPGYLLPVMTPFRVSALALMLCASAMLSSCGNSGSAGGDDYPLLGAVERVDSTDQNSNSQPDSTKIPAEDHNVKGGITYKKARQQSWDTDSSRIDNYRTVGKIRVVEDTLKTDSTETIKGEIQERKTMGIMYKKEEKK